MARFELERKTHADTANMQTLLRSQVGERRFFDGGVFRQHWLAEEASLGRLTADIA